MIGKTFTFLGTAALFAGIALAAQPAAREDKKDGERLICRTIHENGSRLGGYRSCHTRAEWAELRRQTKQTIDSIQNSRAGSGN
ncbi:MAG TPA: hypothetical protein VIT38_11945 [Allosphingosinicella sp.]|jgi:hypothetical protein